MVNCLYIHIPFCLKKCAYCDFYSVPFKSHIADVYIDALCREIRLGTHNAEIKTIYIGGGTPTILSNKEISQILDTIRDSYLICRDAEITIEANPLTITEKKAEELLKSGINRISIGIQSFNDRELAILGRSHNASDASRAVRDARGAGFKNISVDIIYGIPFYKSMVTDAKSQIQDWQNSVGMAVELSPEHISTYELTPEKNTQLYYDIKADKITMPEEEVITEMYYRTTDILKEHGYTHYEISNFAMSGFECLHNLNYWNRGEYVGAGAGAYSFFNSKRTGNLRDIFRYVESLNKDILPVVDETLIGDDEAIEEFIFLGMRKTEGIDICTIPVNMRASIYKAADELSVHGIVTLENNRLRLTNRGILLSSEVIVRILLYIEKRLP